MIKLIKMDIKLNLSDKYKLFKGMFGLTLLFGYSILVDIEDFMLLYTPIILILYSSFETGVREMVSGNYALIQSLAVKRWEYVISKYLAITIKHVVFVIFMVFLLRLLDTVGLNSLEHIKYIILKDTFVIWLFSYTILIPIMFILFGLGRIYLTSIIGMLLIRGYINGFVMVNTSLIAILFMISISIFVSIFVYNYKDLG